MAETKKAAVAEPVTEKQREDIYIPRAAANEEPMQYVSLNFENYLLPKGQSSNVPRHVAEHIRKAWEDEAAADAAAEAMQNQQ